MAVTILPNTDSPMRSGLAGRPMRARTATARELESTAAPTAVTVPCPTTSPPSPSPAVTCTESPPWICAACAGLTLKTTSKAATSATSTSGWFAPTAAPSTAVIRVTTPASGARRVASCCARRAVIAATCACARSAAAWSLSFWGRIPACASRTARACARSALASAVSPLRAAASNGARSNSTRESPSATRWPGATKMRATRVGAGAESSAKCPGRAVTVPMALTSCGKDCFVATAVPTPPTVCSEGGVSAAALAWRSPRQAVSIRAAATRHVQAGLRAIARRGSLSDLAAVPVEQRERQGEPDGRQEAPLPTGVAVVEAHLETGGGEHAAVGQGQRALRRAEGRRGRGDRQGLARRRRHAVGRWRERVGEHDRHVFGGQSHRELHGEESLHGGRGIVRGDVLELPRVDRREAHIELAHVADLAPQLRHLAQAVRVERGAARQSRAGECGERPGVGRIDVEPDRRALEREAVAGGISGRRGGADPRRADPGQVERQVGDHVVVGDVFRVARRRRGVWIEPRAVQHPAGRRGVGATECGSRATSERRSHRLLTRDRLLGGP